MGGILWADPHLLCAQGTTFPGWGGREVAWLPLASMTAPSPTSRSPHPQSIFAWCTTELAPHLTSPHLTSLIPPRHTLPRPTDHAPPHPAVHLCLEHHSMLSRCSRHPVCTSRHPAVHLCLEHHRAGSAARPVRQPAVQPQTGCVVCQSHLSCNEQQGVGMCA